MLPLSRWASPFFLFYIYPLDPHPRPENCRADNQMDSRLILNGFHVGNMTAFNLLEGHH